MKKPFKDNFDPDNLEKWMAAGIIGAVVFYTSIVLVVLYVGFHFVQKYW